MRRLSGILPLHGVAHKKGKNISDNKRENSAKNPSILRQLAAALFHEKRKRDADFSARPV